MIRTILKRILQVIVLAILLLLAPVFLLVVTPLVYIATGEVLPFVVLDYVLGIKKFK